MFEPVLSMLASPLWATTNALARRFLKSRGVRLKSPVISVGNIVAGGVGKTEITAAIAKHFISRGLRVCVASRGYGSPWEKQGGVAHDFVSASSLQFPDESQVLLRKVPGAMVAVGASRVKVLERHWEELNPSLVLLDDGYQHFAIRRNIDILVHDFSLKWPVLREFPSAFSSVPLKISFSPVPEPWKKNAEKEKRPWVRAEYRLKECVNASGQRKALPKNAFIFCGIGNPDRFKRALEKAGTKVIGHIYLSDHAKYDVQQVRALVREFEKVTKKVNSLGEDIEVLTTLKDFVKLEPLIGSQGGVTGFEPLWVDVEIQLLENEDFFWKTIDEAVASHSY